MMTNNHKLHSYLMDHSFAPNPQMVDIGMLLMLAFMKVLKSKKLLWVTKYGALIFLRLF